VTASDDGVTATQDPEKRTTSDAAIARYRAGMRRARIVYVAVLALVVVVVGVVVAVAWSRGEVAHTTLHTVSSAPPSVAVEPASPTLHRSWTSTDRVAIGTPQWGGTVVTYSAHTVGGRVATTGARTWSYTRSDRSVCTAAQLSGTTIAIYRLHGNCDEVTALDSATGKRRWTRTLDKDGKPIEGTPRYQVMPYTLLAYTSTTAYAIDPVSGLDRWTYNRYGCTISRIALGSSGALIGQTCSSAVRCTNVKFCTTGPQLLLRDGNLGNGDSSDANADQIKWLRRNLSDIPVSADSVLTAVAPDGVRLTQFDASKGTTTQVTTVARGRVGNDDITAAQANDAELIWISGRLYAVRAAASTPQWSAPSPAPPTVVSPTNDTLPALSGLRVTVLTVDGVASINASTGTVAQRYAVPHPDAAVVYPLGAGFLVTSDTGVAVYR
jgi:hypothetical protein